MSRKNFLFRRKYGMMAQMEERRQSWRKRMNQNNRKKNDVLLAVILLLLAAVMGGGYWFTHRIPALRAEVTIDGELVKTLDLSKDQEVMIQGARGGTNRLVVQEGRIWCAEASCPDQVCVHQGKQSHDGELIVCLPSLMIVQIIGEE